MADALQFVEVVDAGPRWTKVRTADGRVVTLKGNRNWRNNNPGNLEYGDFAKANDAVGTDGRFAVFPSFDDGLEAMQNLLFGSPKYSNLSISDAISRYAPSFENDVDQYVNVVSNAAGVPASTPLKDLTPEQRDAFVRAQIAHEGFKPGRIVSEDGTPLPPADIPLPNSEVATALDTRASPPLPRRRPEPMVADLVELPKVQPQSPPPMPATNIYQGTPASTGNITFGQGQTSVETPPQRIQPLPSQSSVRPNWAPDLAALEQSRPATAGRPDVESAFTRGSIASFPPSNNRFAPYPGTAQPPSLPNINPMVADLPPELTDTAPPVYTPPTIIGSGVIRTTPQMPGQGTVALPPNVRPNVPPLPSPVPSQAQMQAMRALPQTPSPLAAEVARRANLLFDSQAAPAAAPVAPPVSRTAAAPLPAVRRQPLPVAPQPLPRRAQSIARTKAVLLPNRKAAQSGSYFERMTGNRGSRGTL